MANVGRVHRRRIGELLVSEGLITIEQLEEALEVQKQGGDLLGTILMDMGLITESDITKTLCIQYQLPFLSLVNYEVDSSLVETFPAEFLHEHKMVPFDRVGKTLLILVGEIPEPEVLKEVPRRTNLNAALYVGYLTEVRHALSELAPQTDEQKAAQKAKRKAKLNAAKKVSAGAHTIEIVPGGPGGDETPEDTPLLFGDDKESFLEELDTTWDSILQEAEGDLLQENSDED